MPSVLTETEDADANGRIARWTRTGLTYGALLSGAVVLARVVSPAPPSPYELSTWEVVTIYVVGGTAGGATFGIVGRYMRSLFGAAVVGLLVFLPTGLAVSVIHFRRESVSDMVLIAVLGSVVLGPPSFVMFALMRRFVAWWQSPHPRRRGPR